MRMWCGLCKVWVESGTHRTDHFQSLQSKIDDPEDQPGVPVWRMNPPTVPGLYWFQLRTNEDYPPTGVTRHCRVVLFHGDLVDQNQGVGVENAQRWWAGPLLEPEIT